MSNSRVFVLPSGEPLSKYTIITLAHPQTGQPTRYLVHPSTTLLTSSSSNPPLLYEITKISNPSITPRSWLFTNTVTQNPPKDRNDNSDDKNTTDEHNDHRKKEKKKKKEKSDHQGEIIQDAHLYIATPIDPLYLLLPHLLSGKTGQNFIPLDDILEHHPEVKTWNYILKSSSDSEQHIQSCIRNVCETIEAAGEEVYKLDEHKVMNLLLKRIEKMAIKLPGSVKALADRQLAKPLSLQAAVIEVANEPTEGANAAGMVGDDEETINDAILEAEVKEETGHIGGDDDDSQTAINKPSGNGSQEETAQNASDESAPEAVITSTKQAVTASAVVAPPPEHVLKLSYVGYALQLIVPYLPTSLHTKLVDVTNAKYSPEPLVSYLAELKLLREEAASAIEGSMMHSKRTIDDVEGGVRNKDEAEREKKRKKKEDEAKKSQGVKKLEKVNTRGMAKMTAFFKKKE